MTRMLRLATVLVLLTATACGGEPAAQAPREAPNPLLTPSRLTETAPATFRVRLTTSAGEVVLLVHRDWAPLGVDRFYNLVKNGFYDDVRVYRVLDGFMAQFGLNGDPRVNMAWKSNVIVDDPVAHTNARGTVSFAKGSVHTRTTEVFINYRDNASLDERGFAPIAEVVEGMDVVDAFYKEYGDGPPRGDGPYQAQAQAQGNAYLDASFPELTRIERAVIEPVGA